MINSSNIVTSDLSKFTLEQLIEAGVIFNYLIKDGFPKDFDKNGIELVINKDSGFIFLTNSNYEVVMVNHNTGKLENWYTSPNDGREGFFNELSKEYKDMKPENREWFKDIADNLNKRI